MRSTVVSAGVLCALFCSCLAYPASANPVPDWRYCSVTGTISPDGVLIAPGPMTGTTLTVSVRNSNNVPWYNATVRVLFDSGIHVCQYGWHTCVTDHNGLCSIQLRGGGCVLNAPRACVVTANGVDIKYFLNVKSPDNGAHSQSQADGTVNVVDLGFFGDEFQGTAGAACHDYDNNAWVNTQDLGYFGDAYGPGLICALR